MNWRSSFVAVFFLFDMAGCKRDEIQTYLAPKEIVSMPPMAASHAMNEAPVAPGSGAAPSPTWEVPSEWQQQPASAMRVGSFLIKGDKGQADVSVVPLSGDAGGDLANINRWRGQIQLPPLSEEDLRAQSRMISLQGKRMRWIDFTHNAHRITAVIYKAADQTWFFKMTGDDPVVRAAQPAFRDFIASTQFPSHE